MSQIPGGVQLVFEVDRSRVDSFLEEMRQGVNLNVQANVAGPPDPAAQTFAGPVGPGGNAAPPAAGAGGGAVNAAAQQLAAAVQQGAQQIQQAFTAAAQQVAVAPRAAPYGGGAGGVIPPPPPPPRYGRQRRVPTPRAGRSGGGRRGQWGRLTRVLSGGYAVFEGLRLANDVANYNVHAGLASSDRERLAAEDQLQKGVFGIPIVGQVAGLATLPYRSQTDTTAAQATQQDQFTASLQQAMQFAAGLAQQSAAYSAGPPGSDQFRQQEIEGRAKAEQERIRQQSEKEQDAITAREQAAISATTAAQQRYEVGEHAVRASPLGQALPQSVVDAILRGGGVRKPDVEGEDATASADASRARGAATQRQADNQSAAQREATEQLKELNYQRQRSLVGAQQQQEIAQLQLDWEPDTARAQQIYNSGTNRAEAARHRGRPEEAQIELQTTGLELQKMRRDILEGGSAQFVDNPGAVDFGGRGATGLVSAEHTKDDTAEALTRIEELLGRLTEAAEKAADSL